MRPPFRLAIVNDTTLPDLAACIRETIAGSFNLLPAFVPGPIQEGKLASISGVVAYHAAGQVPFDRAVEAFGSRVYSVLWSVGKRQWKIFAPTERSMPVQAYPELQTKLEVPLGPIFERQPPGRPCRFGGIAGALRVILSDEHAPYIDRLRLPPKAPWRLTDNSLWSARTDDFTIVTCHAKDGGWHYGLAMRGRKGLRWSKRLFLDIDELKRAAEAHLSRLDFDGVVADTTGPAS